MTLYRNTAEGYNNGDNVTTGTSGGASGDAFPIRATGTSSILQASTDHPNKGSKGYKYTKAAGDTTVVGFNLASPHKNVPAQIDGHYLTTQPTAGYGIIQFRVAGGTPIVGTVQQRTDGKLEMYDTTNALVSGSVTTGALSTGVQYVLDARVEVGTGTGDGKFYVQAKKVSDGTVDATMSITTANLGTTAVGDVRFLGVGSSGAVSNAYADNLAAQDGGSTAFITPATNALPTANAGADQIIAAGTTLTLAGSGTDTDGTISSYAWTKVSGPSVTITNGSTATASVTSIPAGHYVFRLTVTDNLGGTGTDDVNVAVTTLTAVPDAEISNAGSWTNVGAAATRTAALADALDTTYMESPANPTNAVNEQQIQPLGSGQSTVTYRLQVDATSPARSCLVSLVAGSTVIASETRSTADSSNPLSTSWQDYTLTLSQSQMAALTAAGGADLRLRFTAS